MKRASAIAIALGVVAIAAALYFAFFRSSDEERIKEQLARLAKAVSVTEEQKNPITRLAHLRSELSEVMEKDVRANICHGARIFARYLEQHRGNVDHALLAYNGCVRGTNTPDCHLYPGRVYTNAGRAAMLNWLDDLP